MGVMKELASQRRICAKHGPFYQDEWYASDAFDECPFCEQEAVQQDEFESSTMRLSWAVEELQDFAKRDATAEEIAAVQQALAFLHLCLRARQVAKATVALPLKL